MFDQKTQTWIMAYVPRMPLIYIDDCLRREYGYNEETQKESGKLLSAAIDLGGTVNAIIQQNVPVVRKSKLMKNSSVRYAIEKYESLTNKYHGEMPFDAAVPFAYIWLLARRAEE